MNQLAWAFMALVVAGIAKVAISALPYIVPGPSSGDEPVIAPSQLLGSGALTSMDRGSMEGFSYNLIAAGSGRVIVLVDLAHNTGLHVVAIGAKSGLSGRLTAAGSRLAKVDLEGNYPNDFSMYTTSGTEQELLQLFDPADMAYFADFCRAYDVELYHESLYFSQAASSDDTSDTTPLTKDVQQFLHRNQQLLRRFGAYLPAVDNTVGS